MKKTIVAVFAILLLTACTPNYSECTCLVPTYESESASFYVTLYVYYPNDNLSIKISPDDKAIIDRGEAIRKSDNAKLGWFNVSTPNPLVWQPSVYNIDIFNNNEELLGSCLIGLQSMAKTIVEVSCE